MGSLMGSKIFQFKFKIYEGNHIHTAYNKQFLQTLNKQNSFYCNRIKKESCINKRVTTHSHVHFQHSAYIGDIL